MSGRPVRRVALAQVLAWAAVAFGLGCYAFSLPSSVEALGAAGAFVVGSQLTLVLVGGLLAARRPSNPIGWCLLVAGDVFQLLFAAQFYAELALERGIELPHPELAVWLVSWIYNPFVAMIVVVVLLFPDGRLPSPRWRPALWAIALFVGGHLFLDAFGVRAIEIGLQTPAPTYPNPFSWSALADRPTAIDQMLSLGVFGVALIAVASLTVRFRRSRGLERQQLKWFVWVGLVAAPLLFSSFIFRNTELSNVLWLLGTIGFALLPVAIGSAVLRYRLYDIDVLIRRTAIYGATTIGLAVTFFGVIVVVETILSPFIRGNELAVAASTLVSLALFQPLRRRVQEAVDRRFYRSRYDAARVLDAFSERLRDEVDLDAVRADLVDAAERTVRPAHASVWIRSAR